MTVTSMVKRATSVLSLIVALATALGVAAFASPHGGGALTLTCRITGQATPLNLAPATAEAASADDCCKETAAAHGDDETPPQTFRQAVCCDVTVAESARAVTPVLKDAAAPVVAVCWFTELPKGLAPRTATLYARRFWAGCSLRRVSPLLRDAAPRGPPVFS